MRRFLTIASIAALTVAANVLAARHRMRWDVTSNRLYTLSPATHSTLRDLKEPIDAWVLLGSAEPLYESVKQLLARYKEESSQLRVHFVDPDRDKAALSELNARFHLGSGALEEGQAANDPAIILAHGDRHWFLSATDLYEAEGTRATPTEERAITGAIRRVLETKRTKLCFSAGHGEMLLSPQGLAPLQQLLMKDNFDTPTVDLGLPNGSLTECDALVIADPHDPFAGEKESRIVEYLGGGGHLFVAAGPGITDANDGSVTPTGLEPILAPYGISFGNALVIEADEHLVIPKTLGMQFIAAARLHAITDSLVSDGPRREAPHISIHFARPLVRPETSPVVPIGLLSTSDRAYAITHLNDVGHWTEAPLREPTANSGPFTLAMASQRVVNGKISRVVVIGSGDILDPHNWSEPLSVRGAALLVENSLSWLTSRSQVLDIPTKQSVSAGLRITEESRAEVRRYVLILMPLAAALLGAAILFWRRSKDEPIRGKR